MTTPTSNSGNSAAQPIVEIERRLAAAARLAGVEEPFRWFAGMALGSVTGELRRVDDFEADNEIIIVPKTGPASIRCTFPESMRDEIGRYFLKTVRVKGKLQYSDDTPYPIRVYIEEGGVSEVTAPKERPTFRELRGLFAEKSPK